MDDLAKHIQVVIRDKRAQSARRRLAGVSDSVDGAKHGLGFGVVRPASRMHGFQSTLALLHWQKAPLFHCRSQLANTESANLRRIGPAGIGGPAARAAIELSSGMLSAF